MTDVLAIAVSIGCGAIIIGVFIYAGLEEIAGAIKEYRGG